MRPRLIHEVIGIQSCNRPGQVAVYDKDRMITYAELGERVRGLGSWLLSNLEPKSRIGIMLRNSLEMVCALYGLSYAGMTAVPIDADLHPRNLAYIADDCSLQTVITEKEFIPLFRQGGVGEGLKFLVKDSLEETKDPFLQSLPEILEKSAKIKIAAPSSSAADTAAILYTTGTTGLRKGVMLSHKSLLSAVENINAFMGIGPDIVESLPMRLSHSFGFARMRCVFDVGGSIILENGFLRPEQVLINMKEKQANAIASVPAGISILLEMFPGFFEEIAGQVRYIEIGSDFMKREHKEKLLQLCPQARLCMHYGLTEASRATFLDFHRDKDHLDTVGRPSPNVKVKIVDETGRDVKSKTTGEILVKGGMTMKGYWGNPTLTKKALVQGWLHTGDTGFFDRDGYLHLVGRKEDILNIGGLKVAPAEIEDVLLSYEGILEAAAVGYHSADRLSPEKIKAFIVVRDKNRFQNFMALKKYCLEEMEAYKIPDEFEIVDELPRTSSGKARRRSLQMREKP